MASWGSLESQAAQKKRSEIKPDCEKETPWKTARIHRANSSSPPFFLGGLLPADCSDSPTHRRGNQSASSPDRYIHALSSTVLHYRYTVQYCAVLMRYLKIRDNLRGVTLSQTFYISPRSLPFIPSFNAPGTTASRPETLNVAVCRPVPQGHSHRRVILMSRPLPSRSATALCRCSGLGSLGSS